MLIRAMKVLKFFEFSSWHAMGGRPTLPDSISEEKLKIESKMEDLQAMPLPGCPIRPCFVIQTISDGSQYNLHVLSSNQ